MMRNFHKVCCFDRSIDRLSRQCSYAVCNTILFTSVPFCPSIRIIKNRLKYDGELHNKTTMTLCHIIIFLEFYLKCIYFLFQERLYEQIERGALGSPISQILVNIYI